MDQWKESSQNWLLVYETTMHQFSLLFAYMYRNWKKFIETCQKTETSDFDMSKDSILSAVDLKLEFKDILEAIKIKVD